MPDSPHSPSPASCWFLFVMPPNASDTLPEDAWANAFNSASTRPVLNALSRRLQASNTHVHALSELYRERAVIEQEYSTKLAKLARSAEAGQLSGKGSVEWERHSAEAKLFDAVVADLQEVSSKVTCVVLTGH